MATVRQTLCMQRLLDPDRLWINDGKGIFRAVSRLALRHTSENSMGVDFADVDRDGNVDFFVLRYAQP